MLEEVVEVAQHSTETLVHTSRTSSRRGWQWVLRFAKDMFEMLSFTGVVDSEAVYDNCVCHRVVAEPSSNCEELQLLLSHGFRVSLCSFFPQEQRSLR